MLADERTPLKENKMQAHLIVEIDKQCQRKNFEAPGYDVSPSHYDSTSTLDATVVSRKPVSFCNITSSRQQLLIRDLVGLLLPEKIWSKYSAQLFNFQNLTRLSNSY